MQLIGAGSHTMLRVIAGPALGIGCVIKYDHNDYGYAEAEPRS